MSLHVAAVHVKLPLHLMHACLIYLHAPLVTDILAHASCAIAWYKVLTDSTVFCRHFAGLARHHGAIGYSPGGTSS